MFDVLLIARQWIKYLYIIHSVWRATWFHTMLEDSIICLGLCALTTRLFNNTSRVAEAMLLIQKTSLKPVHTSSDSVESPTPLLIAAKRLLNGCQNINFGRHRQLDDEVGWSCCCYHVQSCQAILVLKEIETSWSSKRRSCVLLSGCCPTNLGVCMSGLAYEPHERADKIAGRYPASCSLLSRSSSATSHNYEEACCKLNLPRLADRRHSLCRTLFQQRTNRESHILHYLLIAGKVRRWSYWPITINEQLPNSSCADKSLQKLIRIVWTI